MPQWTKQRLQNEAQSEPQGTLWWSILYPFSLMSRQGCPSGSQRCDNNFTRSDGRAVNFGACVDDTTGGTTRPDAGSSVPTGPSRSSCVPYNDTCPAGEACAAVADRGNICLYAGPRQLGESCSLRQTEACVRGAICLSSGSGGICFEPCNHNNSASCSMSGQECSTELTSQGGFGICRDRART